MSRSPALLSVRRLAAAALAGAAFSIAACADPAATGPDPLALEAANSRMSGQANADVNRDLAKLRTGVARFHRFDDALASGYTFLFNGTCMEQEDAGGMGLHYVNVPDANGEGGLLDDKLEADKPEAIMYEPGPGGQLVMVGVEYVVPGAAWTSEEPPVLFGQAYSYNPPPMDLWTLHVWAFKNNPKGMFAGWNPNVSCQYYGGARSGAHH